MTHVLGGDRLWWDPPVGSAVRLTFQLIEGMFGEVHAMLGVGGSMRGRKVEQNHGSLLARTVVKLIQGVVQAHHRVSRPTGDKLAITEETGQTGRIEEVEPLGILATGGQRAQPAGRAEPEDLSGQNPAMTGRPIS